MKFILIRTSSRDDREKPLNDKRIYKEKINIFFDNKDMGTAMAWVININSLNELNNFIKENGEIVIEPYPFNINYMILEIYDSCRE